MAPLNALPLLRKRWKRASGGRRSLRLDLVDVRLVHLGRFMATYIALAEAIGEDEDAVRRVRREMGKPRNKN